VSNEVVIYDEIQLTVSIIFHCVAPLIH